MSLNWIFDAAKRREWVNNGLEMQAKAKDKILGKGDAKCLFDAIAQSIAREDADDAANLLVAGLVVASEPTIDRLRRRGLLRPSKHNYKSEFVAALLGQLRPALSVIRASHAITCYFDSISNLHELAATIRIIEDGVIDLFRQKKHPMLKRLLAQTELLFMADMCLNQNRGDKSRTSLDIRFWQREDFADGLSYLIQLFNAHVGPFEPIWLVDDDSQAGRDTIIAMLLACHVRAFQEWETLVDGFGYLFLKEEPKRFTLRPPDDEFERCMRLGFILRQMAFQTSYQRVKEKEQLVSLQKVADLFNKSELNVATLQTEPVSRLRFEMPFPLFEKKDLLPSDGFYEEEACVLDHFAEDWLADVDEILEFAIRPHVRIRDLIRLQRIFRYMTFCMGHHLVPRVQADESDIVSLRSVILAETFDRLKEIAGNFVEEQRLDAVLSCLCWDPANEKFFDILYQPIMRMQDIVFVPVAMLANSNVIRNSIRISESKVFPGSELERFPKFLDGAFSEITESHAQGVRLRFAGHQAEIDNIARVEHVLFVLEVKAPLEPTGSQELRVTWDHIRKGQEQLDRFVEWYKDVVFRKYLAQRVRFSLDGVTQICTAICVANRMFTGYRTGDHPIVGAFDLAGFIRSGRMTIGNEVKRFWTGDRITADDLEAYINGALTYGPMKRAMYSTTERYLIGDNKVAVRTYALNMLKAAEELGMYKAAAEIRHSFQDDAHSRGRGPDRKDRKTHRRRRRGGRKH